MTCKSKYVRFWSMITYIPVKVFGLAWIVSIDHIYESSIILHAFPRGHESSNIQPPDLDYPIIPSGYNQVFLLGNGPPTIYFS